MIIHNMNPFEAYENLAKDKDRVKYAYQKLRTKVENHIHKERKFPFWRMKEFTSRDTNNKYLLFVYVDERGEIQDILSNSFALMANRDGKSYIEFGCMPYPDPDGGYRAVRMLKVYDTHFAQRYKERILRDPNLSADEAMCRYITRNGNKEYPITLNADIQKRFEEYDTLYALKSPDGLCFMTMYAGIVNEEPLIAGFPDVLYYEYRTIIPWSQLAPIQQEALKKESTDSWFKLVQSAAIQQRKKLCRCTPFDSRKI